MKALVTGAAGLIGAHIVHALLAAGHDVRPVLRATSRREPLNDLPVTCVVVDLTRPNATLDAACADCEMVFHTAADFSYGGSGHDGAHDIAVVGTETVLRASARMGVRRVIVTSSSVVFGYSDVPAALLESDILATAQNEPRYVAAKIAQHRRTLQLGAQLGLEVCLVCPTMTIGPTWSRLGPSNGAILAYLADPFGSTFAGGCNFVSARDVAAGHLLVALHGAAGESYLVGAQNLDWRVIHKTIADLAGIAPPRLSLNHTLALLAAAGEEFAAASARRPALATREQAGMVGRYYWYSHAKAATLGYSPATTRDALIETISWLAASPHVSREVRANMRLSSDIYRYRSSHPGHAP